MIPEPRATPAALRPPESCLCCASEVGAAWTREKCRVRPRGRAEPGCTAARTPGARRGARTDQLWGSCLPHTGVDAGLGRLCRRCVGTGRGGRVGRLWGAGCEGSGPDLGVWTPPLVPTVPHLVLRDLRKRLVPSSPHPYDWREGRRLGGQLFWGQNAICTEAHAQAHAPCLVRGRPGTTREV